ncbi:multicopper oxidase domain-containing protein [Micromonospora sp. STR1s_5]|nr:multicopper oxidase domain-containing protein [Micromonospora sp. STR1s_5]
MVSRRNVMKAGATAGAAALVTTTAAAAARGSTPSATPAHGTHTGHGKTAHVAAATAPFAVRMPIPPVQQPIASVANTDFYVVSTRKAQVEILPGTRTEVLTYDGLFPGPTFRVKTGRLAVIAHSNHLDMPTAVHVHGGHTPSSSDGFPTDVLDPGKSRIYSYPNKQRAATLWYHDHAHHMEAEHVFRGLAGFFLIDDPAQAELRLPSGSYDIPIMLRDARFADDASLIFEHDDFQFRNTILVNGKPQPYFPVAARKYRLRFVNASNLRTFTLRLGNDAEVAQIASDGGLLAGPTPIRSWSLTPGERIEIVVDFGAFPVGSQVFLDDAVAGPVLRFDVNRAAADTSRVPDRLSTIPALPAATKERAFTLNFNPSTGQFLINGQQFDAERVDTEIKRNTTEVWTVTNGDTLFGIPHNFHPHLVQFRVLARNGQPPAPGEAGMKDTIAVGPGETVRLQATFGPYLGRYVYHCHMIDHSASGMMAQMKIVP